MTARSKKRIALLATLVFLLGAGVIVGREVRKIQREKTLEQAYQAAMEAKDQGDHTTVVSRLGYYLLSGKSSGLEIDPELWLIWADSRRKTPDDNVRHLTDAIQAAREARDLMPGDPRPLELLLELYGQVGRLTERLDTAEQLLEVDPENLPAGYARTLALWQLGRTQEAAEASLELAERHPNLLRTHELALHLMLEDPDRREDAWAYVEDAILKNPDDLGIVLLRARTAAALGRVDDAREAAKQAADMEPTRSDDFRNLLTILDALEMSELAQQALDRETERSDAGSDVLVTAAERAWKAGLYSRARAYLNSDNEILAELSDNFLGWSALLTLRRDEEPGENPALRELRGRVSEDAILWVAVLDGFRAIDQREWGKARERLSTAIAADPMNALANFYLGIAEFNLGEQRQATLRWRSLARTELRWVELHRQLASSLLQMGRLQDAYSYAARGFVASPDQSIMAPTLARTAAAYVEDVGPGGDAVEGAMLFLREAREKLPESGEVLALLARGQAAVGAVDEARRTVEEILEKQLLFTGESLRALMRLSRSHDWGLEAQLTQLAEAIELDDPSIDLVLALQAASDGRIAEGRKILTQAVEQSEGPRRVEGKLRLALYLDAVRDPEALSALTKLAEEHPDDPQMQLSLLQSAAAWSDEKAVNAAIARLRRLAGEASTVWKIHEARRLLTFEPSERNASKADLLLSEVIRSDPSSLVARELAAEARQTLGDTEAAIRHLGDAILASPDELRLYPRMIYMLQQVGDVERAESMLRRFAAERDISSELRRQRAALLSAQGLWDLAIEDVRLLAEGGQTRDKLALADLHVRLGRPGEAARLYEQLLEAAEAEPVVFIRAAEFYAGQGRINRGREVLSRLPDEPAGRRTSAVAAYLARHGEWSEAEAMYTQAAERRDTPEAWNELARFYMQARRLDDAEQAVARGRRKASDDDQLALTSRAITAMRGEGDQATAIGEMLSGIGFEADSQPVRALRDAIKDHERRPDNREAFVNELRRIAEQHNTFYPVWQLLAIELMKDGRREQALDAAQRVMRLRPADPSPARLATEIMVIDDRIDQAIVMARQWRQRSIENPIEADLMIAHLESLQQRHAEGLRWLDPHQERIIAQGDAYPARLELLAGLLANTGRADEAHRMLWERAQQNRDWALRYLGVGAKLVDEPATAREWIGRVTPLLAEDARGAVAIGQAWFDLGVATRSHDDFRRAIGELEKALDSDPDAAFAASLIAASYEQMDDHEQAEAMYRLALRENPDIAPVLNNLSYLLTTQGGSLDEALTLAERAVALSPETPVFLDTQGAALLRLGRVEEAERVFRRGLSFDPADLMLTLGLAESLLEQDRDSEAERLLNRVELLMGSEREVDPQVRRRMERVRAMAE
ncbi:MAG: hypothetical protein EA376_11900 [Phycisphaeraceae bacterium]|nr:MAG: hypothetical protein EA376_11900 [Phycisphaeraceae bacterium]